MGCSGFNDPSYRGSSKNRLCLSLTLALNITRFCLEIVHKYSLTSLRLKLVTFVGGATWKINLNRTNSVALVRKRSIPTDQATAT
jgi:hypothetical protein